MNYVDQDDLSLAKLLILNLSNFHPLLAFKFRYDPILSRQNRFLLLYLKISIISLISFILFRNVDLEDSSDLVFIKEDF